MRTWERLRKLQAWLTEELCVGREYKCPVPQTGRNAQYGPLVADTTTAEPRVFLAWQPARPGEPGRVDSADPYSVCPSITVMPSASYVRYTPEHRFDRYNKISRSQDMGQSFCVQLLFSIYEPGNRMPGFVEGMKAGLPDMRLLTDGTEPGLETLVNWMDDAMELILRERTVPGTDLMLEDDNFMYALYSDQNYVVDRRPIYYGFLNVEFKGYASNGSDHGRPTRAARLLDGMD